LQARSLLSTLSRVEELPRSQRQGAAPERNNTDRWGSTSRSALTDVFLDPCE
jgi:hypothetical protein